MSGVKEAVEVVKSAEPTIANALQSVVDQLVKVKEQHGEQITSTVLETSSFMAMNELTQAVAGIIFVLLMAIPFLFFDSKKKSKNDNDRYSYDQTLDAIESKWIAKLMYSIIYVFFSAVIMSYCISSLANPVNWKGVVKPEVYLTYQLLKKAK